MKPIHIFLADDHQMIRSGIRALLERQTDMKVVGEASNGREAVRLAGEIQPDVVVMDMVMPELNGIEATRQIANGLAGTKVICLTGQSDERQVAQGLAAGASGYVLKDAAFEELVTAVRAAVAGKVYVSPSIAGAVLNTPAKGSRGSNGHDGVEDLGAFARLSSREREVLQLLAEGKATKEIAMALKVSVKTVETHRANTMNKLSLFSVAELTKYAVRQGISSLA